MKRWLLIKKLVTLWVCCLLLSGCATSRWVWQHQEDGQVHNLEQDLQHCRVLARSEVRPWNSLFFTDPFLFPPHRHFSSPFPTYFYGEGNFHYQVEVDRYIQFCMKAKGWSFVPLPDQEKKPK